MTEAQPKRTSKLALTAFIISILVCIPLVPLIGTVLGIIALVRINDRPELGGKGLAIAAIPLGVSSIFFAGIFAAIAIPNFIKFQTRSKQSEPKSVLKSYATAQRSFALENGRFAGYDELGVPVNARYYTYYLGDGLVEPDELPATSLPPGYASTVDETGFVAVAVGNIDGDETIDVWTIDHESVLENPVNDVME